MSRIFRFTIFSMIATIAWLPLRSWTQEAGQAAAFKTEEIEQPGQAGSDQGNALIQSYKSAKYRQLSGLDARNCRQYRCPKAIRQSEWSR